MSTPHLPEWDSPEPLRPPTGIQKWYSGLSANQRGGVILTAIAIVVLIIIVIAANSNSNSGGPALTPGSATANQICQTMVGGSDLTNTLSGQDTGTKPVSFTGATIQSNLNGSGNEVVSCDYTLNTGADFPATVTLFANGSTGLTGG